MRTARQGLNTANPLRAALKSQNVISMYNACRNYAVYERTKPHVNIGTIGHVDHGKVAYPRTPKRKLAGRAQD